MPLAHCQLPITDDAGNLMVGASVEVRDEGIGNVVTIKPNRDGSGTLLNPHTSADGYADFYVAGNGAGYKITATLGALTATLRYRAIGTAAEFDAIDEDDMVSDSAIHLPTQQSVKAYVDDEVGDATTAALQKASNLSDVANAATAFGAIKQVATSSATGVVEHSTDAELRSAAPGNLVVRAEQIETASALVALTDAAPVAVDWDAGVNFSLTVTAARQIGNPTNGQPGTWRTILVQGNNTTDRTITFGANFLGEVPTITDCDDNRWYLLSIYCVTTSHFVVSSKVAKT